MTPIGNVATGYTGTVHFTSSDAPGRPAGQLHLHRRRRRDAHLLGHARRRPAPSRSPPPTRSTSSITGTQSGITVNAGRGRQPSSSRASPARPRPARPHNVTVTAHDAYGNVATGYTGTVHFTSSDGHGRPAGQLHLHRRRRGRRTSSRSRSKTAGHAVDHRHRHGDRLHHGHPERHHGQRGRRPAQLGFVQQPTTTQAGSAISFTALTAQVQDQYGNIGDRLRGHGPCTVPARTKRSLPGNSRPAPVRRTGSATFNSSPPEDGRHTADHASTRHRHLRHRHPVRITVNAASATTYTVSGFTSPTTAGAAHNVTVTAHDPFGNVATGYTGTVHFTSSDAAATLPANYTFTGGDAGHHTSSRSRSRRRAPSRSPPPTRSPASITGTRAASRSTPAGAASSTVSGFPSADHGRAAHNVTVTAQDAFGNVATGYTGTVHFTSNDASAVLPANYTFTGGDAGTTSSR